MLSVGRRVWWVREWWLGRRRVPVVAFVVGLLLALGGLVVPSASVAGVVVGEVTQLQVAKDFLPPDRPGIQDPETVIVARTFTAQAGEMWLVEGGLAVTLSSSEGAEVDGFISCRDTRDDSPKGGEGHTGGTNHPGSGAGVVNLRGSMLFTAPFAGVFRCEWTASTSDGSRRDYHGTAQPGVWPGGSWLKQTRAAGGGWWSQQAADCDLTGGGPDCIYLGGDGDPTRLALFEMMPGTSTPSRWVAASNASQVSVEVDLQVTSCPSGYSSCAAPHVRGGDSTISTHLEFTQLDPAGNVCRLNTTPVVTRTWSKHTHHLLLNEWLTVPVLQTCGGSRVFKLAYVVVWEFGAPVKIDVASTLGFRSPAHASAINTVFNPVATVPDVVGVQENTALNTLQSAGFAPTVQRIYNRRPVGTVIATNSPAGTIEPTGSTVYVTISLGPGTQEYTATGSGAKPKNAIDRAEARAYVVARAGGFARNQCEVVSSPGADWNPDTNQYDATVTVSCSFA